MIIDNDDRENNNLERSSRFHHVFITRAFWSLLVDGTKISNALIKHVSLKSRQTTVGPVSLL